MIPEQVLVALKVIFCDLLSGMKNALRGKECGEVLSWRDKQQVHNIDTTLATGQSFSEFD